MELQERALLRLRGAGGTHIVCVAGRLWVTIEGVSADYFLEPGQTHCIKRNGLVIIEALVASCLVLQRPVAGMQPKDPRRHGLTPV